MNKENAIFKVTAKTNLQYGPENEQLEQDGGYREQITDGHTILSDEEKIRRITGYFRQILHVLDQDPTGEYMSVNPRNIARMYVKEIFAGADPQSKPVVSTADNKYHYNQILLEKNISVRSFCEHHLLPIIGRAHIAYIPAGKIMEATQVPQLVKYYCARPQVMERLIAQLADELKTILETEDIAIVISASHLCKQTAGDWNADNVLVSSFYSGKFNREETRNEFLALIK